jgi:parallel beta-helix repeat protein
LSSLQNGAFSRKELNIGSIESEKREERMKKVFSVVLLVLLLLGMLFCAIRIQTVKAGGTIYIRADGSVEGTTYIQTADNVTYFFTADIINDSIIVQRNNIVIDGNGHTLQGTLKRTGIDGTGIDLSQRTNVAIKHTQINGFWLGVCLNSSSSNSISGNNITNNDHSIGLSSSSSNIISGNNITNNDLGIDLGSSSSNIISGNNITNNSIGIGLFYSSNNSISGNTFTDSGLYVWDSYKNSVENNTVNGKPLVYLEGVANYSVSDAGQVILVRCDSIRVGNLNLSRTSVGVQLCETNNSIISWNNITANHAGICLVSSSSNSVSANNLTANHSFGIYLYSSSNSISGNNIANNYLGICLVDSSSNSVSGNNIANNSYGIYLDSSSSNSVSGNNIANNGYGIELWGSSNNCIFHNNFIDNTRQVYDYSWDYLEASPSINIWGDGYPSGGNYWSDYTAIYPNATEIDDSGLWNTPYAIDANNRDNYPLVSQWTLYVVDLLVSSPDITFSDFNPAEDQLITISARVHNVGEINLENIVVRFLDGDTLIGEQKIPFISHHSQGTASIDWKAGDAGFHLIKVVVDPYNDFVEEDEENNEATRSVFVGTWQYGGIHLTGDITPKETNPCSIVEVSGEATYSTTYGAGEPVAGADITVSIMGSHWTTYTIADGTYKIDVSAPLSPGNYTVVVTITDYTFWERIDLNLTVNTIGGLDLALSSRDIAFSLTAPVENDEVRITATVHNVGTEDASNIPVAFYDNAKLIGESTISHLSKGSSEATGISWHAKPSGWHTITVKVDPRNELAETDESNNDASRSIYVYPSLPDLTPTSIDFSDDTPLINQSITVAAQVTNIGGIHAFDVAVRFYDDGIFLGEQTISSIPPKGETESAQITSSFTRVGWHNVTVVVDPQNSIAEADEDNNRLSAQVFVRLPSVDLALSSSDITFSNSTPTVGDTITIYATVHNVGEVDASDVVVEFFGIGRTTIPLVYSGSSQVASISWTATPAGLQRIVVMADPENVIPESNENNNVASRSIYVSPPREEPRPDLAIHSEDIVFSNTNPIPGETVTIYATIHNIGIASAEDIPVVLYVDNVQIGSVCTIPWLSPGESKTISTRWIASSTGTHTVEVKVDPWYSIVEASKSNNDASKSIYVYPSLPDLTPTSIDFSDSTPLINQSITASTNVRNLGGVDASNVPVRFYDDDKPVGTITIPWISGKDASETVKLAFSFAKVGWHSVTVVVDPENSIAEADEGNNVMTMFVFVRLPSPDLALSSSDITFSNSTPANGDVITIYAEVHNNGEIDARNVVVKFYGIGRTTIPLIPAGSSQIASISWTATPAGLQRIVVMADPNNAISESNENNNVASRNIYVSPPGPPPDLSILSRDIVFSNTNPVPGEKVTIYATVHNVGEGQALDVAAIFYIDRVIPLDTKTITSIPSGGSQDVVAEWTATQPGSHVVTVVVDTPSDSNNDNNMATRAIMVIQRDFSVSVSPPSLSTKRGESVTCTVTLTSIGDFASEMSLSASVNPNTNDVTLKLDPTSISLAAGASAQSTLTISTASTVSLKTFSITITATGGGKIRKANCTASVEVFLEVPYESQGQTSWCGPASLSMVLNYYGVTFHPWDYASNAGFLGLGADEKTLVADLVSFIRKYYPVFNIKIGNYTLDEIRSAQNNVVLADIESNVTAGYPVILELAGSPRHFVVVTGFNDSGIFINDPSGAFFTDPQYSKPGRHVAHTPYYIHEFVEWTDIQMYIQQYEHNLILGDHNTLLCIQSRTANPLFGTLGFSEIHWGSDKIVLDRGMQWVPSWPVWPDDKLGFYLYAYNSRSLAQDFILSVRIVGDDYKTYVPFENNLDNVEAWHGNYVYRQEGTVDLPKTQNYRLYIELKDKQNNVLDYFITPKIYYFNYGVRATLKEQEHHLYLHVYDSQGRHVGLNYTSNETEIEVPDSYYFDNSNGTIIIILPTYNSSFLVVVDGTFAQETIEAYNLTITTVNNGQVIDENSTQGTIQKGDQNEYNVEISPSGTIIAVPEFPSFLILPLFTVATLLAAFVLKRKRNVRT